MILKETIRKVLREHEKQVNLSKSIKNVVDEFLIDNDPNKKYVCSYELLSPTVDGKIVYRLYIYFNRGPNSSNWPRTQAVRQKEEAITNGIQNYILKYVGVYVTFWLKSSEC